MALTTTYTYHYAGLPVSAIPVHGLPLQSLDCTLGIDISEYGDLAWSVPASIVDISTPTTCWPDAFTLTWSIVVPALSLDHTVVVTPVTATWSLQEPDFSVTVAPSVFTLTWSLVAPVVVSNETILPNAQTLTWSLVDPTTGGDTQASATALTLQWALGAPGVVFHSTVTVSPVTATWSLPAPYIGGAWMDMLFEGMEISSKGQPRIVILKGKYRLL